MSISKNIGIPKKQDINSIKWRLNLIKHCSTCPSEMDFELLSKSCLKPAKTRETENQIKLQSLKEYAIGSKNEIDVYNRITLFIFYSLLNSDEMSDEIALSLVNSKKQKITSAYQAREILGNLCFEIKKYDLPRIRAKLALKELLALHPLFEEELVCHLVDIHPCYLSSVTTQRLLLEHKKSSIFKKEANSKSFLENINKSIRGDGNRYKKQNSPVRIFIEYTHLVSLIESIRKAYKNKSILNKSYETLIQQLNSKYPLAESKDLILSIQYPSKAVAVDILMEQGKNYTERTIEKAKRDADNFFVNFKNSPLLQLIDKEAPFILAFSNIHIDSLDVIYDQKLLFYI